MPNTTDTLVKKRLESVIANYSEEDVEKFAQDVALVCK